MPPRKASPEATARRTQQERREETRRRLLDATIGVLVEQGYARLTTVEVARRAGVSQGAIFTHFETKAELLVAAVEHLFPRLIQDYLAGYGGLPGGRDRIGAAVEMLWAVFERPEMLAAVELYVAARTEPELQAALATVEGPHRNNLVRVARGLFPEAAEHPDFEAVVELIIDAVQGGAIARVARPHHPALRRMRQVLIRFVHRSFTRHRRQARAQS
ncbi:TetR/AcrR family transcriptional regulator [Stigmatella aurantiaca]|uniref:Transcriptional regulator, TetR family n=1 Tax=Stigmatella aurantiaca (strain DW4/3-1) TaxID=378806 RepID=E3FC32_STIAD|nr:TetR/AcrR family transcriptional regulator [Stigmatella aurantiaca]ADO68755.1 Transcriptional regulator, TetR family [Stigmatella aurantiaca DW4/3-1]